MLQDLPCSHLGELQGKIPACPVIGCVGKLSNTLSSHPGEHQQSLKISTSAKRKRSSNVSIFNLHSAGIHAVPQVRLQKRSLTLYSVTVLRFLVCWSQGYIAYLFLKEAFSQSSDERATAKIQIDSHGDRGKCARHGTITVRITASFIFEHVLTETSSIRQELTGLQILVCGDIETQLFSY